MHEPLSPLPQRVGSILFPQLVELYRLHYTGRDPSLMYRLRWWAERWKNKALADITDDDVHEGLEVLAQQRARYFAGKDADGEPIHKAKKSALTAASLNRYWAAGSAIVTWAIKRRIAPRGYVNPFSAVARQPENNARIRFLDANERERLLAACRASEWPRLYAFVLLALTSGARRSEILGLHWRDVDLGAARAALIRTKNGEPRTLVLQPAVIAELRRFEGAPSTLVFASPKNPAKPFVFDVQWHRALRLANIRDFRVHDLRHSCASMLAVAGATPLEIGTILGHRTLSMVRRYAHLSVDHQAKVLGRVMADVAS